MSQAIGIDIGGTAIKLGLIDAARGVLARGSLPLAAHADYPALLGALTQAIAGLGGTAEAVGIATPGYADPRDGRLTVGGQNVPILHGQRLAADLGARLGLPAWQINDGIAAALGESRFGGGRGLRRFAVITLGTGVGGEVVIDGSPVIGERDTPPEFGAIVLDAAGPVNYSGLPGTFEAYCCAKGFARAYAEAGGGDACGVEVLFAHAAAAEPAACAAVDAVCRRLAQACGIMINLLGLEACFLGGGIADAGAALIDRVRAHLADFTWPFLLARARVALAETGNDAGLLGAAAEALQRWRGAASRTTRASPGTRRVRRAPSRDEPRGPWTP
jgi:glucokinase